ncbi:Ribosomal small subunit pseudouridine synthase A [Sinobacterium norvegicum]|uniref:Pseudouridine synthase n=1 Tax=Sinobacterium norvegicum TaxID=1641715 RepID=A0ABM9AFX2_9GAMM|nr:16S rRNA pseudouridine(516) synthase [Sinobacterium norvegicum]CAH0992092.1 Ribosomal small subunit pseudouridine synthase A [Sinobacterium norvegicum]
MAAKRSRLDRFIVQHSELTRRQLKPLLATGKVLVDYQPVNDANLLVDYFSHISVAGNVLQNNQPVYFMLNKPCGTVSATKDDKNKTVFDCLRQEDSVIAGLHIVGRLDFHTTGLVLITNDGRWSERLTLPNKKIEKHYRVNLQNPIDESYISGFAEGMYFEFENITTQPARLNIIDTHTAEVFLTEGKYHQIKRMFGRFRNPVIGLHRAAIGHIQLDPTLQPGQYRALTADEISGIK